MNNWTLTMTCPRDGLPLTLQNVASMDCGLRLTAILTCGRHGCTQWQFVGELITIGGKSSLPKPPSKPKPLPEIESVS